MFEDYDIESLKEDIADYLETEGVAMPASFMEACEVAVMSKEEIIKKAKELGVI